MSTHLPQGKESGSANTYLSWQDLLEAEAEPSTSQPQPSASGDEPWLDDARPATVQVQLPPDVAALLAEKERLEGELKHLAGLGEPKAEDERLQRMYPVKVHTQASRIEDRRLRQHDERQRLLKQRALEAKLAQAREAQRQAEVEAEHQRKLLEQELAKVQAQLRQAELEAERRRKALERAKAAARAAQRQAEYAAERQRKELEQAALQARWASDRQKALLSGVQERRQQALWHEQYLSNQRARKEQHQSDLPKIWERPARADEGQHAHLQVRNDEAKRAARLENQFEESVDERARSSVGARLDPLQRLYQKKGQALAWEQEQERLRQNALQRRRENQTVADRLDGRSKNTERFANTA